MYDHLAEQLPYGKELVLDQGVAGELPKFATELADRILWARDEFLRDPEGPRDTAFLAMASHVTLLAQLRLAVDFCPGMGRVHLPPDQRYQLVTATSYLLQTAPLTVPQTRHAAGSIAFMSDMPGADNNWSPEMARTFDSYCDWLYGRQDFDDSMLHSGADPAFTVEAARQFSAMLLQGFANEPRLGQDR